MKETIQHPQPSSSNGHQSRNHPPARQRREFQARNTMMHINLPNTQDPMPRPNVLHFSTGTLPNAGKKIKRMRSCSTCLHNGHDTAACPNKQRCVIANCRRFHHPLLHEHERQQLPPVLFEHRQGNPFSNGSANSAQPPPVVATQFGAETRRSNGPSSSSQNTIQPSTSQPSSSGSQLPNSSQVPAIPPTSSFHHVRNEKSPQSLLFRIIPVKLFSSTNVINTYAMIDEGSE